MMPQLNVWMHYPVSITVTLVNVQLSSLGCMLHQHPLQRFYKHKKTPLSLPYTSRKNTLFPLDNPHDTFSTACRSWHRHDVVIASPASPPLSPSHLMMILMSNNSVKLISSIHFTHLLSLWLFTGFMLPLWLWIRLNIVGISSNGARSMTLEMTVLSVSPRLWTKIS